MSINVENPVTAVEKLDAATNLLGQIPIALMLGDTLRIENAARDALKLVMDAMEKTANTPGGLMTSPENTEAILAEDAPKPTLANFIFQAWQNLMDKHQMWWHTPPNTRLEMVHDMRTAVDEIVTKHSHGTP